MLTVSVLLALIFGSLFLERWMVGRNVKSISLRIHVNGTRGKSSVTEYIAAGLMQADTEVMAKITGITPKIIYNREEHVIKRAGNARVQEQVSIIRKAAGKKVKSLVLECMSVSPELQKLESRIFRPHIYVITNIRDDHREHMGRSVDEQVSSICNSIPENSIVITGENRFLENIEKTARSRKCRLIPVKENDMAGKLSLPDGVFADNVLIAMAACEAAGINPELAFRGIKDRILKSNSDLIVKKYNNKKIRFLNAFAVNDVGSTSDFLLYWGKKLEYRGNITVIFNTREDRPLRTDHLSEWLAGLSAINRLIITGNHSQRAAIMLQKKGFDKKKIMIWKSNL
jgi:poly-gamma-glutamate synthase PgsB/CapB